MKTITFNRKNVIDKNNVKIRSVDFPKDRFELKSFTGESAIMYYCPEMSEQVAIDNEFWDGEQFVALYRGNAPDGHIVTVELWHTAYDAYNEVEAF
jgi:hypothetical protein